MTDETKTGVKTIQSHQTEQTYEQTAHLPRAAPANSLGTVSFTSNGMYNISSSAKLRTFQSLAILISSYCFLLIPIS